MLNYLKTLKKEILNSLILISIPAMLLMVLLILFQLIYYRFEFRLIYELEPIFLYGIPLIIAFCLVPLKISNLKAKDIGLCKNRKLWMDVITIVLLAFSIYYFFNPHYHIEIIHYFFVGFSEEIFFRGILYKSFDKFIQNKFISILIVGIIFGLFFHYDGGLSAFFCIRLPLSILFSITYIFSDSLSIPILLHTLYDVLC